MKIPCISSCLSKRRCCIETLRIQRQLWSHLTQNSRQIKSNGHVITLMMVTTSFRCGLFPWECTPILLAARADRYDLQCTPLSVVFCLPGFLQERVRLLASHLPACTTQSKIRTSHSFSLVERDKLLSK